MRQWWTTGLVVLLMAVGLGGQVRAPRPPAERPPAPRLADGTPNLGQTVPNKGYWAPAQFQDYTSILVDRKEIPYQPWAKALAEDRKAGASLLDPNGQCLPP